MTAIARREQPSTAIAHVLDGNAARGLLTSLLPEGTTYERFIALVQLAVAKNGAIADCTPASIVTAVGQALKSGLEIGETAHLVPYGRTLTFVADYKGIAQLIVASGAVRHVELRAVYAGDDFEVAYGLDQRLSHRPCATEARGKLVGAYVIFRLPFGAASFEWMPIEDIEAIRQKHSQQWKKGDCPPWYAKKTVLRQAAKTLRKDGRLARVFRAIDADLEAEVGTVTEDEDEPPRQPEQGTFLEGQQQEEAEQLRKATGGDEEFQDDRDLAHD